MGRSLLSLLFAGLIGTGFGVALGFFLFPYVFPPPPAAEMLNESERAQTIAATGMFIHANPSDPVHWGKGGVAVRQGSVFLSKDFEVGPGPKSFDEGAKGLIHEEDFRICGQGPRHCNPLLLATRQGGG